MANYYHGTAGKVCCFYAAILYANYLAGKDKIQRANLDGSGMEQLITGSFTSEGIALDRSSDKMYYSTFAGPWESPPDGKIFRSNLDGSNPENLLSVTDRINGLALDLINSKMYWTQIEEVTPYERSSWICLHQQPDVS